MKRWDFLTVLVGVGLVFGLWVAPSGADVIPRHRCVTTSAPKTCSNGGNIVCGAKATCGGECWYCDSSVVLPNKVCMVVDADINCTTTGPTQNCGANNNKYRGTCMRVTGSTNCTCENPQLQGTCGTDFSPTPCQ